MRTKIYLLVLLIVPLLLLAACKSDNITSPAPDVEATVKITDNNYNPESFQHLFPDTLSLHRISAAFSVNYSEDRRNAYLQKLKDKVKAMGQDATALDVLIANAGCYTNGAYVLPTYVEKAKYDDKDAWLVQFAYGLYSPAFEHFKCFAFSIAGYDTLAYSGCK